MARGHPNKRLSPAKAVAGGADDVTDLKRMLMNRYGLDDNSAFFVGKETWYSVSSGGYINSGAMADGPHPLCNDFVPASVQTEPSTRVLDVEVMSIRPRDASRPIRSQSSCSGSVRTSPPVHGIPERLGRSQPSWGCLG